MVNVNDFQGCTDSDRFDAALASLQEDGILEITPRKGERNYWLIDRAILLPENTTVVLRNVTIQLSDACRDNFFRTANCGMGIEFPAPIRNVHIRGEGLCVLQGADHPRATGDGSKMLHAPCPHYPEELCELADWLPADHRIAPEKITFSDLHEHSYGTDAGKEGESQYGDWRGIGILFANAEHFSISGVTIRESHGWGISLEACSHGRVEKIVFDARMHKNIDGMAMNLENEDGVDIRNGCHHIVISDIMGQTGDDVVALTAIANSEYCPGGSLCNTHVMHNDWSKRERDIHDIVIRNIIARSYLCHVVRLLPADSHIYNVVIDGVIDTKEVINENGVTLRLGSNGWGELYPDAIRNLTVSNVICNSKVAVKVGCDLTDSAIMNLIDKNPEGETFVWEEESFRKNTVITNAVQAK